VIKEILFFANYKFYSKIGGNPRTVGIIFQDANIKLKKLLELYKRLKWDIEHLNKAVKRYYDKKRIKKPVLKKRDKIYLL
jgi:hypothetical protein